MCTAYVLMIDNILDVFESALRKLLRKNVVRIQYYQLINVNEFINNYSAAKFYKNKIS